jgi:hypothetical protein
VPSAGGSRLRGQDLVAGAEKDGVPPLFCRRSEWPEVNIVDVNGVVDLNARQSRQAATPRSPLNLGYPQSGAMAGGDEVEVGQTVRFHVRDAGSADKDLRRTLSGKPLRSVAAGRPVPAQSAIAPGWSRGMAGQN